MLFYMTFVFISSIDAIVTDHLILVLVEDGLEDIMSNYNGTNKRSVS